MTSLPPPPKPTARRSPAAAELVTVLRLLVDKPQAVEVDEVPVGRASVLFEARLAADDAGKVIGRQGKTIDALRTLLAARGEKTGERYDLELLED